MVRFSAWLVLLALAAGAARAEDLPPACSAAHDGVQICMSRQVCTCGYDEAGSLIGRTPGWRWSCDIMQTCDSDVPADAGPPATPPWPGPLYVTPNLGSPGSSSAPQTPQMPQMPLPPLMPRP